MTAKADDGRLDIVPQPLVDGRPREPVPDIVVGDRRRDPVPEPSPSEMLREAVSVPVVVVDQPAAPPLVADARTVVEPAPEAFADMRFIEPLPEPPVEEPAPAPAPRVKKSWREQRWERRRRRIWFEEVLAWILVPIILIGGYFFVDGVLTALGTSPSAIFNGLSTITSNF